jgi:Tol biopolymer transport system component
VSGLSPDSRWIAFVSDEFEPGHFEVYVTSTQPGGTRTKISDGGATEAMWTRSGREILYWHGDQMMSVEVSASDTFVPQRPRVVFTNGTFVRSTSGGAGARQYDVSADGQHFVMMMQQRSSVPDHLNVTRGWDALVQARLAGGPPK